MKNILVIMLRYIGDVLLATPVVRALRDHFPNAHIAMAVNKGTEDVVKRNPDLNDVMGVPKHGVGASLRFLREVRSRRFDCVLDLTDGDRAAILTRSTGAPVRVGFNEEHYWRGLLYTSVVKGEFLGVHRVERNLEAVRALGIEPKSRRLVLEVSSEDEAAANRVLKQSDGGGTDGTEGPLIMLQPGARYWFKAWPAERFALLSDRLVRELGCRVLVGGDAAEREIASTIQAACASPVTNLAGQTDLLTYAAILKQCALFIGNDNGPLHMAVAVGTPVVGLFGPSNPAEWGPLGGQAVVLYKGLDCRPCFHPTCYRGAESCMNLISVDEVFAAAEQMLQRQCEASKAN